MLLIQVLLIQVSTIIIFDNLYVQNQSTTTAQALAHTKTRMTTWLNSNFRGRWKEVSGPNVTLASNQWMIVMRIGIRGLGVREVVEAMDMDQMTNPNVRSAILTMRKEVRKIPGIRYSKYTWNPAYKGVDDYLLSQAATM